MMSNNKQIDDEKLYNKKLDNKEQFNNKEQLDNKVRVIGITGEAGSGKTTITKMYAKLKKGFYILTDDVAKDIMEPGSRCYEDVVKHFGEDILYEDKHINRPKLASIVFNDRHELNILNSLVHGQVVTEVTNIITDINSLNNESNCGKIYNVVLIESAILFQVQELVDMCDEVWYVEATYEDRKMRLKRDRDYSDERIEAMSISQEHIRLSKKKCDKVIINDRDIEGLKELLATM